MLKKSTGVGLSFFRSQLFLDEQRLFFDIWRKASNQETMPTRKAISPCEFSTLLPYISLFEFEKESQKLKITVTGSALRGVFGDDPKKILLNPEIEGAVNTIMEIRDTGLPKCGVCQNFDPGRTGLLRFWLRLPLGSNAGIEGIIGLDMSLGGARAPIWALEKMRASLAQ